MGHPSRCNEPTIWQHVTIRGVAQRSICDRQADGEMFFGRVARSVKRGDLQVMAFCLMPNHAHLIVRSPSARLGDAMRDVEGVYVRSFNRPRGRLGHLMQGRYWARPIRTQRYMTAAIAYIDLNPVEAGLVAKPAAYPFGSARCYARTAGPPWLDRSWVEAYLRGIGRGASFSPEHYAKTFGTRTSAGARRWMSSVMVSSRPDDTALDDLIEASPEHILRWMDERSRIADGTARIVPLVDLETVLDVVSSVPSDQRMRTVGPSRGTRSAEQVLVVGLLRRLVGSSFAEIAAQTGSSTTSGHRTVLAHDWALAHDGWYRELVGRVSRAALDICHPRPPTDT